MGYLRDGVATMLSTRLSAMDEVTVVDPTPDQKANAIKGINEAEAREMGTAAGVDRILYGSLTILGDQVSMDAKLVQSRGKAPALSFFRQVSGLDGIIPAVSLLAEDIGEKAFGTQSKGTDVASAPSVPGEVPGKKENAPPKVKGKKSVWRSPALAMEINGLTVADVDGDGHNEIIIISQKEVDIYRRFHDQFVKIKTLEGESHRRFLAVDAADINRNGVPEIFLTCISAQGDLLQSFVIEWNGSDFTMVQENLPFYFRLVSRPGHAPLLACQKKGWQEAFSDGIYALQWNGSEYAPGEEIPVPSAVDIFGLAMGKITDDGKEKIVRLDKEGRLQVLSLAGEQEWRSQDSYGGSENYVDFDKTTDEDKKGRRYLNQRLFLADTDRDGKLEVLTVENDSVSGRLFGRFRQYSKGYFSDLAWDGLGLALQARTKEFSNYISDFNFIDVDNDGNLDVVLSVVAERESLVSDGKSQVISLAVEKLFK